MPTGCTYVWCLRGHQPGIASSFSSQRKLSVPPLPWLCSSSAAPLLARSSGTSTRRATTQLGRTRLAPTAGSSGAGGRGPPPHAYPAMEPAAVAPCEEADGGVLASGGRGWMGRRAAEPRRSSAAPLLHPPPPPPPPPRRGSHAGVLALGREPWLKARGRPPRRQSRKAMPAQGRRRRRGGGAGRRPAARLRPPPSTPRGPASRPRGPTRAGKLRRRLPPARVPAASL
uniref:Uncharacterized protein n=1 Tax=Setaria viridis TaxID=4556 RepID=A0A4U6TS13_SETVI|nr:hypothetical protein SEVIR_7G094650v2 [Setaria viridis]